MTGNEAILFVEEPGRPPLPLASSLLVASHGVRMVSASGSEQACEILNSNTTSTFVAVVANCPNSELFALSRKTSPRIKNILISADTIYLYTKDLANRDVELIDHVIARTTDEWTNKDLRITLQKIIQEDLFGVEKYLSSTTPIHQHTIKSSRDRDTCNQQVQKWVESCGLGKNVGRLAFGITEELLMNAIYDAPVAGGRTHYESMERTSLRELQQDEYSTLTFASDGKTLAISILDPFGAFKRDKWWQYVRKILRRDDPDGLIDTKKGGAGLGIFKMLYSSHGVICNVEPNKRTEVIVLIDLTQPVRDFGSMPRSVHYFCN